MAGKTINALKRAWKNPNQNNLNHTHTGNGVEQCAQGGRGGGDIAVRGAQLFEARANARIHRQLQRVWQHNPSQQGNSEANTRSENATTDTQYARYQQCERTCRNTDKSVIPKQGR